jgi:aldehyde:ferredoxin oxidoreductase
MQGGSGYLESRFPIPGVPFEMQEKYVYAGKGDIHRYMSNLSHIINVTGLCYFAVWVYGTTMIPQFMEHVTGEKSTMEGLLAIGERISTLRMAFTIREGVRLSDWKVPGRMIGDPPLDAGPLQGVTIDLAALTGEYLEKVGWDPLTGKPSLEKLEALKLKDLLRDL